MNKNIASKVGDVTENMKAKMSSKEKDPKGMERDLSKSILSNTYFRKKERIKFRNTISFMETFTISGS